MPYLLMLATLVAAEKRDAPGRAVPSPIKRGYPLFPQSLQQPLRTRCRTVLNRRRIGVGINHIQGRSIKSRLSFHGTILCAGGHFFSAGLQGKRHLLTLGWCSTYCSRCFPGNQKLRKNKSWGLLAAPSIYISASNITGNYIRACS